MWRVVVPLLCDLACQGYDPLRLLLPEVPMQQLLTACGLSFLFGGSTVSFLFGVSTNQ